MRPKYFTVTDDVHEKFEFLSVGPKGTIKKIVLFKQVLPNLYNLGFGDWDESQTNIHDDVRSNNGDRALVLTTVAFTVVDFLQHHPDAVVFVQGNTPARTRLYQMGIIANWHVISVSYELLGFSDNGWEPFQSGKNYESFIIKSK